MNIRATNGLRIICWPDIHGLCGSEPAIELAAKITEAFKPNVAINIGDGIDASGLSNFHTAPSALASLQDDLEAFYRYQLILNSAAPDAKKFYTIGNHDQRVQRALERNPQWMSLDALKLENLLQLPTLDMALTDSVFIGSGIHKVEITHGVFAKKWSGTSIHAMLENRGAQHSIVMGHSHRASLIHRTTSNGPVWGVESGWLGDPTKMKYMEGKQTDWVNAVVMITFRGNPLKPSFTLVPFHWRGNKVSAIYGDKEYE